MKISSAFLMILLCVQSTSLWADKAVFAGGCFWCVEALFQELPGVEDAVSGFTGGTSRNPTYRGDHSGHYESVEVAYNPEIISYDKLLDIFWRNIDPFDRIGQFCDKGPSYRSAIFYSTQKEFQLAEASLEKVRQRFPGKKIHTQLLPRGPFYPISGEESHHQDYYLKYPLRYKFYRLNCGRDKRLKKIWGEQSSH